MTLKNFNNYIFESKNSGNLYHIVDYDKLSFILDNNIITSYNFSNISTTRNKMLNNYIGNNTLSVFKLELDGIKISHKYKIVPFRFKSLTDIYFDENEEQILTNKIDNALSYINKIILIKDKIEYLKKTDWFTTDGGYTKGSRNNFPYLLKILLEKIKNKNIDIYIQENNVIRKDDNYIDSILNYPITKINHAYTYYLKGSKKIKKDNYNIFIDDIIPLDNKNNKISELVVGYKYNNLWLCKNKPIVPNYQKNINYKLCLFDFVYEDDQIIKEIDDFIYIKQAKLIHIDFIT
jgi:hypothetical protein